MQIKDIQITRGGTGGCNITAIRDLPRGGQQVTTTSFSEDEVGGMTDEQIEQLFRRLVRDQD